MCIQGWHGQVVRQKPAKLPSPVRIWVPPSFFYILDMLYLVATPIGNLTDITFRAVEVLNACDIILAEDTRHSGVLMKRYDITTPLRSFHKFNEAAREEQIIADLREGKEIALISDAGTPGIADPGQRLVALCREEGIPVTAIPGACAAITALTSSGFDTERFQFCGFIPKKTSERKKTLLDILTYPGTSLCYESPQRLISTLNMLQEIAPERPLAVARELTKKFEENILGTASELLARWAEAPPKGECVLMISGQTEDVGQWEELSPKEHVAQVEETYGVTRKEAIKIVAELRGVPKRTIYNTVIKEK